MPSVQLTKTKSIKEIITDYNLTALEMNILLGLRTLGGSSEVMTLIEKVRKTNPTSYKFTSDSRFYTAIVRLHKNQYVVYG